PFTAGTSPEGVTVTSVTGAAPGGGVNEDHPCCPSRSTSAPSGIAASPQPRVFPPTAHTSPLRFAATSCTPPSPTLGSTPCGAETRLHRVPFQCSKTSLRTDSPPMGGT